VTERHRGGITVFSSPTCAEGSTATAAGRFDKLKHVSGRTFYNEVTASRVTCGR